MAFFPFCSSLCLEGVALFLGGIVEEGQLFLELLDGGVDFVGVIGRKELEFLELIDDLDSVGELLILGLLLFLLLLVLLLGGLLVQVALLAGDNYSSTLNLLLPFLAEDNRAGSFLTLLMDLEGIGSEVVTV